jgi:hypothetical protein
MEQMPNCVRRVVTRCQEFRSSYPNSNHRVLTLIRCGTLLDPGFMDSQHLYEVDGSIWVPSLEFGCI